MITEHFAQRNQRIQARYRRIHYFWAGISLAKIGTEAGPADPIISVGYNVACKIKSPQKK
jgi:hypothetical protein